MPQSSKKFLLYRTYHGCAMSPPVQAASIAAWQDEAHVVENRRLYREKFAAVTPILATVARSRDAGCRRSICGSTRRRDDTRIHARALRRAECFGAARQLSRARSARREPGRTSSCASRWSLDRRMRRSRAAHRGIHAQTLNKSRKEYGRDTANRSSNRRGTSAPISVPAPRRAEIARRGR